MKQLVQVSLFFLFLGSLTAQDIHFTQFYLSPITTNPGNTGNYYGSVRVGGIYRGQLYSTSSIGNYKTPLVYLDAPIITGFRKKDWVGIGATLYQDKTGVAGLTNSGIFFSAAYHLALGSKSTLSVGAMGGSAQVKLSDLEQLKFGDGLKSGSTSADISSLSTQTNRAWDFSAGAMVKTPINNMVKATFGLSFRHLTQPRELTILQGGGSNFRRPLQMALHGQFDITFSPVFSLTPMFFYQTTAKQREVMVQALSGFKLKKEDEMTLQAGLGYRLGDAVQLLLGADWGDLRVGLGYDVTTSGLTAVTKGQGAFEVGLAYIFKIYKNPDIKPVIFCPRF